MVRTISLEETLPLRSAVLRKGLPLDQCIFPTDSITGIYHLGCFVDGQLICTGTFFPEDYPEKGTGGFRLRGMATDPVFAGQGYGAELINFAVNDLSSRNAAYIWCNARTSAAGFYEKLGFELISGEFEIPGIGPHYNMLYPLTTN